MNHDLDRWLHEHLGSPVRSAEPLVGGLSSKVTRCRLDDGRSVVVREITDAAWFEREPDLLDREAAVLVALLGSDVRVPDLLAIDNDRATLAMSFVEGVMRTDPEEIAACAEPLAELIADVHQLAAPPGLRAWRPWGPSVPEAPAWAVDQNRNSELR